MEIIDRNNCPGNWENNEQPTAQQLFETIGEWKWEELRQLLECYFSMIEHLEEMDYLVKNVKQYDETLLKLLDFSRTEFMEKKAWRRYDNGEVKESCWAHLRNLLSPFNNMIAVIKSFSKREVEEKILKSFIESSKWNFKQNKKKFSKFCEFLGEESNFKL